MSESMGRPSAVPVAIVWVSALVLVVSLWALIGSSGLILAIETGLLVLLGTSLVVATGLGWTTLAFIGFALGLPALTWATIVETGGLWPAAAVLVCVIGILCYGLHRFTLVELGIVSGEGVR